MTRLLPAGLLLDFHARRRGWIFYALPPVIVALAVLCVYGWTECVAWIIAYAPNRDLPPQARYDPPPDSLRLLGVTQQLRIDVGPPSASICVWIIDPPRREKADDAATGPIDEAGRAAVRGDRAPRGTILFLHGIRDRKESLLFTARRHARRGYRCILVDARGHGRSTGEWITYGVQESRDCRQVVDALYQRRLVAGRLGVYGVSFGAATALQYSGRDPRVAAVVAISAFSSLHEVVDDYVHCYLPLSTLVDDDWIDRSIERAGRLAHFDPAQADCVPALADSEAQVLLIHGAADRNIPPEHSRRLQAASPERTRLVLVENADHNTITWDRTDVIWHESTAWFDRWLAGATQEQAVARP